jgi:tartrate-resistant acid phosphatase type 5
MQLQFAQLSWSGDLSHRLIFNVCSSLHFLTSGGGSKAWRGRGTNKDKDTGLQFYYDGQGFAAVSMAPSLFHMDFYDISGNILHSLDLSKD